MPFMEEQASCVILLPRGGSVEPSLQAEIGRRGWRPVPVDDAHHAMAELGRLDRARRHDQACTGLRSRGGAVLVLDAARVSGDDDALRRAMRQDLGDVRVLGWGVNGIQEIEREPDRGLEPRTPDQPASLPPNGEPPDLRLAGTGVTAWGGAEEPEDQETAEEPATPSILTREEIDMLLSNEP